MSTLKPSSSFFETLDDKPILSFESTIRSCARTVRLWCEEKDNLKRYPTMDLNGWCAIAAAQLWRELKGFDIEAEIHMWKGFYGCHVYVVVQDHVVDVTATQFKEFREAPIVILHKRLAEVYDYYRSDEVFYTPIELIVYQRKTKWEAEQVAWA